MHTDRLRLRPWRDEDLAAFAALNADPVVRRFFPRCLDRAESNAEAGRIRTVLEREQYGFWAAEAPGVAPFIGFIGLAVPRFDAHFTPAIEIGWRLARAHWGNGYATEGASRVLAYAFGPLGLPEVVAFTAARNQRSRALMERLGMRHDPADDFDHPRICAGHPLRRHVLYRVTPAA